MDKRVAVRGITVDAAKASDLDDAVWVERTADGGYRLTVSVADVASLVEMGSDDDTAAASKGVTVYAAQAQRESMFHSGISHDMASLAPGQPRPVVALVMDFGPDGEVRGERALRATVTSEAKLSYDWFDVLLHEDCTDRLVPLAEDAVELAALLWCRRVAETGVPFWNSAFDERGDLKPDIYPGQIGQTVVHEFMVAANAASTRLVRGAGAPMIYRNQSTRGVGPSGRYEVIPKGHDGLGIEAYGQFTSPIRRYTDLVNQRLLCAAVEGAEPPYDLASLTRICADSNRAVQRAEHVGRPREPRPPPTLDRLDYTGFRRAMEQASLEHPQVAAECARRLRDGKLTHSDAAWILFAGDATADDELKAELLGRLAAAPAEAAKVWECGFNEQGMPMFESETRRAEEGWISAAAVGRNGACARADDAGRARGLAIVKLIGAVVGVEPAPGAHEPFRFADMFARAKLVQLCRVMNWTGPDYDIRLCGQGARQHYTGTVKVVVDDFEYRSPIAHAATYKGAEAVVASMAMAALEPYADDMLKREAARDGVNLAVLEAAAAQDRPLTALADFCRRYGGSDRVVWLEERPSIKRFRCRVEVTASGNTLSAEGEAATRTGAMEEGARAAIEAILERARSISARPLPSPAALAGPEEHPPLAPAR